MMFNFFSSSEKSLIFPVSSASPVRVDALRPRVRFAVREGFARLGQLNGGNY